MNRIQSSQLSRGLLGAVLVSFAPLAASAQSLIHFDDLALSPESYENGSDGTDAFSSGGASFNHYYDAEWSTWAGWSYSNVTDTTTGDYTNQYSAITGSGLGETGNYAVGYVDTFTQVFPEITLGAGQTIQGIRVTNATYPYYSMRDGDAFSKQFGGASGDDADFFRLTITGLDASEAAVDAVDFYLADYRFEDDGLDTLVDEWQWVDLSGFGEEVRTLRFSLESSDTGVWGMNTPAYFALGEVSVIPEPATVALFGGLSAAAAAVIARRRKRSGTGNRVGD